MVLSDRTVAAQLGAFILIPEDTPHSFSHPGQTPAKLIMFCSADFREQYFEGLDERQPSQELLELMQKFD